MCSFLLTRIQCHPLVKTITGFRYRGFLGNNTLGDEVWTEQCFSSLTEWFNSVVRDRVGKWVGGGIPQSLGGFTRARFNETCLKDPATGCYCNDADFPA